MKQPDTATADVEREAEAEAREAEAAESEQAPKAKPKRKPPPKPDIPLKERAALSPTEAAAMLGIARATLYRAIANGRLQTFTLGRSRRISMRAIDAFIATREGA